MLINPQLFNYRLVVCSLLIALVITGALSITSLNALKNSHKFLTQEKKLVENELYYTVRNLNRLEKNHTAIYNELVSTKCILDSITDVNKK